jgi:hypothetical protein
VCDIPVREDKVRWSHKIDSPGKHITYISQEECRGHERSADDLFDGYPERLPHFPREEKAFDRIYDQEARIRSWWDEQGHITAISLVIHQHAYKEDKRLVDCVIENVNRRVYISWIKVKEIDVVDSVSRPCINR